MALFSNFTEYFNAHSLKGVYRKGVFLAIKVHTMSVVSVRLSILHFVSSAANF